MVLPKSHWTSIVAWAGDALNSSAAAKVNVAMQPVSLRDVVFIIVFGSFCWERGSRIQQVALSVELLGEQDVIRRRLLRAGEDMIREVLPPLWNGQFSLAGK